MESPWSSLGSQSSFSPIPTPWEESQQQPLPLDIVLLQSGAVQCSIPVSHQLAQRCEELKEIFTRSKETSSQDQQQCASSLELCSSFMKLILDRLNEGSPNSSLEVAILGEVLRFVQTNVLLNENINTFLASMSGDKALDTSMLRTYFQACAVTKRKCTSGPSQFLANVQKGHVRLFALFNGQGVDTYFDELAETYGIYEEYISPLMHLLSDTLVRLAADDQVKDLFLHGLDVKTWLSTPESRPKVNYLTSAAVSLPLIAVSQLVQYAVLCTNLDISPGELRQLLDGSSGHSQGVVVASFIATADSWDGFYTAAQQAVEVLFWIGARCQQSTTTSASGLEQSLPSYMLSVKGLSQNALQEQVDRINAHLPPAEAVHLALVNGPQQFVIAGLPRSLRALEKMLQLQSRSMSQATNPARVPFSQRPPVITTRSLPIPAPFHSPYLQKTEEILLQDLASFTLCGVDLAFPVYHTETAENLQSSPNIIPQLVQMICTGRVEWEMLLRKALPGFTHVLDFGPGGDAGIGSLVSQQRDGTGLRITIVSAHRGLNAHLSYAGNLYSRSTAVSYNAIWGTDFAPLLVQSPTEARLLVDTKFSRLLSLPPVMVAGMTPTTTAPEFVAAIVNAGFHAELACGGFPDADKMRQGILSLAAAISPGRGITCNVIYANPRAMAWQIPLLAELRRFGVPITGLTIGAGVPSPDIVQGYIDELSLEHLALKPGSKAAIDAVLEIARANPNFPIILQWTGGRGGGHHSYEDFHAPILDRYGQIRSHSNVILVAGSGFGDGEGTYPYVSGAWSEKFGRPRMPFDAILLGSRVMAAQEAHTSLAVKQAICQAPGVVDYEWEGTYKRPTGGILSVRSEMGEPIHKLATRGVMLWAELDQDIFSLPRDKQKQALLARKEYYIRRLNEDFQKVWFGRDAFGTTVNLQEMTYAEVWQRLVDLLYLQHLKVWIDPSFQKLVWDFTRRLEERLSPSGSDEGTAAVLQDLVQLDQPEQLHKDLFVQYPQANTEIITAADAEYVLLLSRRRGQKPVPYIIALDEDLEYWFKKDSLWQSERLEAVPDHDVGRVCILHGPVAAQYTIRPNEPVKNILDDIHNDHATRILQEQYSGNLTAVPSTRDTTGSDPIPLMFDGFFVDEQEDGTVIIYVEADSARQPSSEQWLRILSRTTSAPWCRAMFGDEMIVQDGKMIVNPIHTLFTARRGRIVEMRNPESADLLEIIVKEVECKKSAGEVKQRLVASASLRRASQAGEVILTLWNYANLGREAVPLEFRFKYDSQRGASSITEVVTGRNAQIKQYYQTIWIGNQRLALSSTSDRVFRGEDVVLTREMIKQFAQSICNRNPKYTSDTSELLDAPLDLAIAVGWRPLMSCLFYPIVSGDMLRLLHLSNSFEYCEGAEALKEADCLSSEARLASIRIKKGIGKVVEAEGVLHRNGTPVIRVRSTFMLLGEYKDHENTFATEEEKLRMTISSKKDIALLQSRRWLLLNENVDLDDYLHENILFQVRSRYSFQDSDRYASLSVEGHATYQPATGPSRTLGSINLSGDFYTKNPVTDFLQRHGSQFGSASQPLSQTLTLIEDLQVTVPDHADQYGQASGDCNPIHLSELFASYAGHDTRVTHGMFTSGLVRALVESHVAQSDPSRMRSWSCNFEGKVSPGDTLSINIDHVGMSFGNLLLSIRVHNTCSGIKVLSAQSMLQQPMMAYVFTGQGSQKPGMGMDLGKQSASARLVWQAADNYFGRTYGFPITRIVRDNPKTLTVYFGGVKGNAVRENYISLTFDTVNEDGMVTSKRVFPDITASTRSYTFRSTNGLLHQTQFTQPALALMEIARFEDMRDKGLVKEDSLFAGHSLGEYVALVAMGKIFTVEEVSALVFYRGLTMQNAVKRDVDGATDYSMCAVNPTRVSEQFSERDLHWCVAEISRSTSGLLEIVNYNVANTQYVCAGDLRGLATLSALLDAIASGSLSLSSAEEMQNFIQKTLAHLESTKKPLVLQRGRATVPLNVNVPFHSSLLRPGVHSFRNLLQRHISEAMIDPRRLIGKYIPNLVAKPFELSKEYAQGILDLTKSPVLESIIQRWPFLEDRQDRELSCG